MIELAGNPLLERYLAGREHLLSVHPNDRLYESQPGYHGCMRCALDGQREPDDVVDRRVTAFAVPDDAALDAIARHAPRGVVEIGAGTGYWAALLARRGLEVDAFDLHPAGSGDAEWCGPFEPYFTVHRGDAEDAARFPERSLFMCWPYMDDMALRALMAYRGETLIYIGEGRGGCTASDEFFDLVDEEWGHWCQICDDYREMPHEHFSAPKWRLVERIEIPQWWGLHDALYFYGRIS